MYASLELSKELYDKTGWETGKWFTFGAEDEISLAEFPDIPLYDLGYLLRKLEHTPTTDPNIQDEPAVILEHSGVVKPEYRWCAKVFNGDWYEQSSSSMEDAACKLAIELFNQGILPVKEMK